VWRDDATCTAGNELYSVANCEFKCRTNEQFSNASTVHWIGKISTCKRLKFVDHWGCSAPDLAGRGQLMMPQQTQVGWLSTRVCDTRMIFSQGLFKTPTKNPGYSQVSWLWLLLPSRTKCDKFAWVCMEITLFCFSQCSNIITWQLELCPALATVINFMHYPHLLQPNRVTNVIGREKADNTVSFKKMSQSAD
jgi:hypothetical protein